MEEFLKHKETAVTLRDFINILLGKWYIFLATCIVCVLSFVIATVFFITPTYQSTAKLYVIDKNASDINASEISVSSYLTKDYEEIIVDRTVLEEVINRLSINASYKALKSAVSTNNPSNTRFIEITVSHSTAQGAKSIVDCICDVTQQKIIETMDIDRVVIFSLGDLPTSPSSPNLLHNILKGLIIGLAISFLEMLYIFFKDDKINTSEDIEKYLEISVLGSIPYIDRKHTSKRSQS